jgi:hypothetical protein
MNTLKYYDALIAAGNNENQARAHIAALEDSLGDLVTKDYFHNELEKLNIKMDNGFNLMQQQISNIRKIGYWGIVFLAWPMIRDVVLPFLNKG